MSQPDEDETTPKPMHVKEKQPVLPVAAEEEPEDVKPSVGESWAPRDRDDHMSEKPSDSPAAEPEGVEAQRSPSPGHDPDGSMAPRR